MHLVEDDGADTGQLGVGQEPAQQDARSAELDARRRPDVPLSADRVADDPADAASTQGRQSTGGGPHGDPARLGDDDPGNRAARSRLPEHIGHGGEKGRHEGGLAAAGRRVDHRDSTLERLPKLGQGLRKRQSRGDRRQIERDRRACGVSHPSTVARSCVIAQSSSGCQPWVSRRWSTTALLCVSSLAA